MEKETFELEEREYNVFFFTKTDVIFLKKKSIIIILSHEVGAIFYFL